MAKPKTTTAKDSLATFTNATASAIMQGGPGGYRDSPLPMPVFNDYTTFYRSSWICRAAVDAIPEDCFKRGYQWVAEATQITAIEAVEKRLGIVKKKQQAMAFSRLDGEAYLYIDTGQSPSSELVPDRVTRDRLRFVNVVRASQTSKGPLDTDPISQNYGRPEYYTIGQTRIHPSRMIQFINSPDPATNTGTSALVYLLPPIIAAETARDNVVALTTEACMDIMSVEGLMDAVSDPETEAAVVRRYALFRQMKGTNRMGVIDKEKESYEKHPTSFATLPDVIETMRREVAAAIGIPYALLFGRPQGLGTNGEVELKNYYDNISTMQRNDIEPVCEPLDECVIRSALGSRPPEIYMEWRSLWEMTEGEKATVAKTYADAAKTATDAGVVPPDVLTESLINSWVEIGAFQGIEQNYKDWVAGGGVLEEPADPNDATGRDLQAGEEGSAAP